VRSLAATVRVRLAEGFVCNIRVNWTSYSVNDDHLERTKNPSIPWLSSVKRLKANAILSDHHNFALLLKEYRKEKKPPFFLLSSFFPTFTTTKI
jgi:hypothetical protein